MSDAVNILPGEALSIFLVAAGPALWFLLFVAPRIIGRVRKLVRGTFAFFTRRLVKSYWRDGVRVRTIRRIPSRALPCHRRWMSGKLNDAGTMRNDSVEVSGLLWADKHGRDCYAPWPNWEKVGLYRWNQRQSYVRQISWQGEVDLPLKPMTIGALKKRLQARGEHVVAFTPLSGKTDAIRDWYEGCKDPNKMLLKPISDEPLTAETKAKLATLSAEMFEAHGRSKRMFEKMWDDRAAAKRGDDIAAPDQELCNCSCADPCPLGRVGSELRCTKLELEAKLQEDAAKSARETADCIEARAFEASKRGPGTIDVSKESRDTMGELITELNKVPGVKATPHAGALVEELIEAGAMCVCAFVNAKPCDPPPKGCRRVDFYCKKYDCQVGVLAAEGCLSCLGSALPDTEPDEAPLHAIQRDAVYPPDQIQAPGHRGFGMYAGQVMESEVEGTGERHRFRFLGHRYPKRGEYVIPTLSDRATLVPDPSDRFRIDYVFRMINDDLPGAIRAELKKRGLKTRDPKDECRTVID